MKALHGCTVIDFTRVLAGPFCTMNLADLGAEVIKVESVTGDDTRAWGPPFVGTESAYYLCANRNKRSLAVDLKASDVRHVITALIQKADVIIHNFKPSSLKALGLDYDQVHSINPRAIYCGISGYGLTDNRPGYDYIIQAVSGLMSITGPTDGAPHKVGVAVVDLFTGLYAAVGILSALRQRETTNVGQQIDIALYDAGLSILANVASNVLVGRQEAKRFGNEHPNIVPYQLFSTADGEIVITVGNDRQYNDFCHALGFSDLAQDERFQTNALRVTNRRELCALLEDRIRFLSTQDVLTKLSVVDVPCGPVNSVAEALESPDTYKRNMVWQTYDAFGNVLKLVGSPLKLSAANPSLQSRPPRLGEHTQEILEELGISDSQIKHMKMRGVIHTC
ncbi:CaiB/BaiF CoA transferase family protein [Alicyclobacillus dauci]|uniref:CoA transferase n=1 Tax=Alicyclobacillus dauci TaxID=1475485 RepID=A0ABY6YX89_9BACL|nr:CaiB/BaiF CoA-transferase family protein [Alicyclobacillus dauci]WAH35205.1 CoA transferase [Alicyclobacillus dauci]